MAAHGDCRKGAKHVDPFIRSVNGEVELRLKVVPGASRTEISGLHGDRLKVRVTAPPEGGKANQAVCAFLESLVGGRATVVSGAAHAEKTIRLSGADHGKVLALADRRDHDPGAVG
ncbi:hypothetical protein LBMAG53_34250 [Planctomycetota bacterium]|nr:hypothetical protein LBMAG53_34250 [Planctomycetota bacterium]